MCKKWKKLLIGIIDKNKEKSLKKWEYIRQAIKENFKEKIDYIEVDFFNTKLFEKYKKEDCIVVRISAGKNTFKIHDQYLNIWIKSFIVPWNHTGIKREPFKILSENGLMKWSLVKNKEDVERVFEEVKWENNEVVLKQYGLSCGKGVSLHHSVESILNTIDFTKKNALLKFIPHTFQYRIVVLGNKAIWVQKIYVWDDFRSNVPQSNKKETEVIPLEEVDTFILNMAIQVSYKLWLLFSGVDIIQHKETGVPFVCEVNSPFDWTNEKRWGKRINIAKALIEEALLILNKK